ncbi:MAG: choloylglycine hydrolase family protein [Cyanobacteria bacterium TGS_CYA1]|nr:choloylglycine hydrolase family protein [Cyanobacteria bacterium TGS_CYA1]
MKKFLSIFTLALSVVQTQTAFACTDFAVSSKDGGIVIGRSMEWGADLGSRINYYPANQKRSSTAPNNKTGKEWTSKYAYFGIDVNKQDLVIDGLNDQGLSMGMLWYPPAVYQTLSDKDAPNAVSVFDLGFYILGNFKTVAEVEHDLQTTKIWGEPDPKWPLKPAVHLALHDASGKNLVVEFVDGQILCHDNPNSVLTNTPDFPWHITNLSNYISLTPDTPTPLHVRGSVLSPNGQGGGFVGIPGDWTPPSRFVRTSCMLTYADQSNTSKDSIILAQHILNAVDIPKGDIRDKSTGYNDYSQWSVIKDLKNKKLYYRSYDNLSLRSLDLNDHKTGKNPEPVAMNE